MSSFVTQMIAQLDSKYIKTRPRKALVRVLSHFLFQGRFLTTEYRWLNKLILTELRILTQISPLKSVEKPVFIVGVGRSGSTILGKVLSIHSAIGFLNEPKAMWYTICPAEDVNGHFTRDPARYRLTANDVTQQNREAAHRLFGTYLAIVRAERVLDKNPELIFRIPFVRTIFPDAKFIFLVRNGWDTISSIVKWSRRYGRQVNGNVEDWWGINQRKWRFIVEQLVPSEPLLTGRCEEIQSFSRHEDMAAVEWIVTMQEGLRFVQSRPDFVHLVRYEDLVREPSGTLGELFRFCELDRDGVAFSYAEHILQKVPRRELPNVSPSVRPQLLETLEALGYTESSLPGAG